MHLKLVEPLRDLFKDEVRALGRELGLPHSFVGRHPFPGPAWLSAFPVRSRLRAGHPAQGRCHLSRRNPQSGLYDLIWQAFAVLLPVKTVGVMGDDRTYEYVCALRAVNLIGRDDGRIPIPSNTRSWPTPRHASSNEVRASPRCL